MQENLVESNFQSVPLKSFLSNDELEVKLQALVHEERVRTAEILQLISTADQRKIFLLRGYPTLFAWLTKSLNYSEGAAHRRIQAARLMSAVPSVSRQVASGEVNLSTLAKTQSAIRFQEKMTGGRVSTALKSQLVERIQQKSSSETDKVLVQTFPSFVAKLEYERVTMITDTVTKLSLNLSGETLQNLERAKALLSHALPEATFAQVIGYLVADFVKRKDPLKKVSETKPATKSTESTESQAPEPLVGSSHPMTTDVSAAAKHRVKLPVSTRREVLQRDQARCSFRDPLSGKVCGSTYQVEVDHILPRSLGGSDDMSNLRCLCRAHNQLMAEVKLGSRVANAWREEKKALSNSAVETPSILVSS